MHSGNAILPKVRALKNGWAALHQAQRHLELLPDSIWASVLGAVAVPDLLSARPVSTSLVRVGQLSELELAWCISSQAVGSIALFISWHCRQPTSPKIYINLRGSSGSDPFASIILACTCADLRHLQCRSSYLHISQAQACLGLAPAALTSLSLYGPAALIEDPVWSRLAALTWLELTFCNQHPSSIWKGTGLTTLSSLQALSFRLHDDDPSLGVINAAGFAQPSITRLEINSHPFSGRLDLTSLPCLQAICVFGGGSVPQWLQGLRFDTLKVWGIEQLDPINPYKLCCKQLKLSYGCGGDNLVWPLAVLLAMPRLAHIELGPWIIDQESRASVVPTNGPKGFTSLAGSWRDYRRFLSRSSAEFMMTVKLCSGSQALGGAVELRRNGHPVMCLCPLCPDDG